MAPMNSYRNRRLGTGPFRLQTVTFSNRENSTDLSRRARAAALSIMTCFALPVVGATLASAEEQPAAGAVEEVIVSSRTPDLIDQIGGWKSVNSIGNSYGEGYTLNRLSNQLHDIKI